MPDRRMLAKSIMETDAFFDMPTDAQMLYVRLIMAADDDGFVSNPRSIMRGYGFADDSMRILISKKFILTFEKNDGFVYLIKHWRVHNYIRNDRYKASTFKELLRGVYYDENNAYSLNPGDRKRPCLPPTGIPSDNQLSTNCQPTGIPSGNQAVDSWDTQVRLDKDRVGKDRVVESREDKNNNILSTSTSVRGKGESEGENPTDGLTDAEKESLNAYYGKSVGSYMRLGYDYDIILDLAVKKGADRDKVLEIARGGPTGG